MGGDPLAVWVDAERFLGVGTRDYSPFANDTDVGGKYDPRYGVDSFSLVAHWVPDELGQYVTGDHSSALHAIYRRDGDFLLAVHPDIAGALPGADADLLRSLPAGPDIRVIPMANTRTVLVTSLDGGLAPAHFLKLHFPRRLSRFARPIHHADLAQHMWTARQFARTRAFVLPDVGGGLLGTDESSWGYILREAVPRRPGWEAFTVPAFALYGQHAQRPMPRPLLALLADRSGMAAADFVIGRLIEPMIATWLEVAITTGCLPEMHGQNALFNFAADLSRTRVGFRDGGVYTVPELRGTDAADPDLPPMEVVGKDVPFPAAHMLSLIYDSFMGTQVLDRLHRVAVSTLGVRGDRLHARAREAFAAHGGRALPMPATIYYYDNAVDPDGHAWSVADTGRSPVWR